MADWGGTTKVLTHLVGYLVDSTPLYYGTNAQDNKQRKENGSA
jgi:hypothetical protein